VREDLVESFAFSPLEVERLAVIEHDRWAADRHLDGWTYGPVRDNARRHHPQLVPYADLSEPMKDLDRFAVRLIPTLLARSGRGVVRILLVGVPEPAETAPDPDGRGDRSEPGRSGTAPGRRWSRLADQALERLVRRYPDRGLVLAATLTGAVSRRIVRRAVAHYGAGFFLLCPRPLGDTLALQPDDGARRGLLALAARAERRIQLDGPRGLARWFDERAEILMVTGADLKTGESRKRVLIDQDAGRLEWTFEY
jgi:hypothetical protein